MRRFTLLIHHAEEREPQKRIDHVVDYLLVHVLQLDRDPEFSHAVHLIERRSAGVVSAVAVNLYGVPCAHAVNATKLLTLLDGAVHGGYLHVFVGVLSSFTSSVILCLPPIAEVARIPTLIVPIPHMWSCPAPQLRTSEFASLQRASFLTA
jgi:hypothetical protein